MSKKPRLPKEQRSKLSTCRHALIAQYLIIHVKGLHEKRAASGMQKSTFQIWSTKPSLHLNLLSYEDEKLFVFKMNNFLGIGTIPRFIPWTFVSPKAPIATINWEYCITNNSTVILYPFRVSFSENCVLLLALCAPWKRNQRKSSHSQNIPILHQTNITKLPSSKHCLHRDVWPRICATKTTLFKITSTYCP